VVNKSLEWNHKLFDDKEPADGGVHLVAQHRNPEYDKYCNKLDKSSLFFQYLYTTVPSVFGKSKGLREDEITQDVLDEIAATRRCRHLSTYNQVATLLSISQTSRLGALEYLRNTVSTGVWPIYRSGGPLYRARPLNTWRQQYQNCQNIEKVPERPDMLVPTICATLDLVVYWLHTASGYPKEILNHATYQMSPTLGNIVIPFFNRIGIEWHSLWATKRAERSFVLTALGM
jgi:hypothetical protein